MRIYGVAGVDRHRNVGHWFTGSGRESDQRDRDHSCQCFHLVCFVIGPATQRDKDELRRAGARVAAG